MFKVQFRFSNEYNWVTIWTSDDGKDCADYLKQNVLYDTFKGKEYRMIYEVA